MHPIGDLRLPYWAGLWFGVFPTWEGVAAQLGAVVVVLGSYFAAEWTYARRRRARIATPPVPHPAATLPVANRGPAYANGNGPAHLEDALEERARRVRVGAGKG